MKDLIKKAVAEAIGTFVLVFCACGVAAFTGGSLVATALAFGLVIVAMAYSIGRISGCHINPAVSLGCLLTGRMSFKDFCGYVISQFLFLTVLIFGQVIKKFITKIVGFCIWLLIISFTWASFSIGVLKLAFPFWGCSWSDIYFYLKY